MILLAEPCGVFYQIDLRLDRVIPCPPDGGSFSSVRSAGTCCLESACVHRAEWRLSLQFLHCQSLLFITALTIVLCS